MPLNTRQLLLWIPSGLMIGYVLVFILAWTLGVYSRSSNVVLFNNNIVLFDTTIFALILGIPVYFTLSGVVLLQGLFQIYRKNYRLGLVIIVLTTVSLGAFWLALYAAVGPEGSFVG